MKAVRILHKILAFLIIPVLGYLLGATIFNYFWNKVETEDLSDASHIIVATSCDRHGPVTLRGFGWVYECRATVTNKANGNVVTTTARGFLRPELIGKQVAGEGFNPGDLYPVRPYAGRGMVLLLPFGVLWFYVYIVVAWRLLPERRKFRRRPVRYQRPENMSPSSRTVRVFGGHRRTWLFCVFVVGCLWVLVSYTFEDEAITSGVRTASWTVIALVIIVVAWRAFREPMIAISPEGIGVAWNEPRLGRDPGGLPDASPRPDHPASQRQGRADRQIRYRAGDPHPPGHGAVQPGDIRPRDRWRTNVNMIVGSTSTAALAEVLRIRLWHG